MYFLVLQMVNYYQRMNSHTIKTKVLIRFNLFWIILKQNLTSLNAKAKKHAVFEVTKQLLTAF